jgi:predicted enzyme related to lactoylglutathione lyase
VVSAVGGYEHHPVFQRPDREAALWRYVSFAKFVDLIDRNCLFFSRADRMIDAWEGSVTSATITAAERALREGVPDSPQAERNLRKLREDEGIYRERMRMFILLSCWHEAAHESAAMWEVGHFQGAGVLTPSLDHRRTTLLFSRSGASIGARQGRRSAAQAGVIVWAVACSPLSLIEFPADDPERARRFWVELLGVKLEARQDGEGEGWQTHSEAPAIGVHARGRGPGDSFSLPYFAVSDVAEALQRVESLGGNVVHPGKEWAICKDSEGSPFGLAQDSLGG